MKERDRLAHNGVNERIILKRILKTKDGKASTGLI